MPLSADEFIHPAQFLVEDFAIKEHEGVERLVLGGRGDVARNGQVGKEGLDFNSAHVGRMPLAMEEDEALDPAGVRVLGVDGVMFDPEHFTNLIEEFGFGVRDNSR